jgi:hypothetical protein
VPAAPHGDARAIRTAAPRSALLRWQTPETADSSVGQARCAGLHPIVWANCAQGVCLSRGAFRRPLAYLPRQRGGRFSANASAPSFASAESRTGAVNSRCHPNAARSVQLL